MISMSQYMMELLTNPLVWLFVVVVAFGLPRLHTIISETRYPTKVINGETYTVVNLSRYMRERNHWESDYEGDYVMTQINGNFRHVSKITRTQDGKFMLYAYEDERYEFDGDFKVFSKFWHMVMR